MTDAVTGEAAYVALAEQHAELQGVLASLTPDLWNAGSACSGWSVSDVVLHLAQTDELARASLDRTFGDVVAQYAAYATEEGITAGDVDDFAGVAVARERSAG